MHGRPAFMRLSTHLTISHSVPVVLLTLALALTLVALIRISSVLTTLQVTELEVLREEGALHAATWEVDVAMRHGEAGCGRNEAGTDVIPAIAVSARNLRQLVEVASTGSIERLAREYLEVADSLTAENVCERLKDDLLGRRAALDEQLTTQWVARLDELHDAVAAREANAQRIAVTTTWIGVPVAALAILLATLIARRMARMVTQPLASLARIAKQVGRGDFQSSIPVSGPTEVLKLALELELMREQLKQLDVLKQGFVASVSHELRTPLAKIREALALLEDGAVGPTDSRQLRVIRIARSACESEIRLVTTLLDLSRLRAGSPLRLRDEVPIDQVLQSAVGDEKDDAVARGVEIVFEKSGASPNCRVDPILLERVVANLLRNAVAVSQRGQSVVLGREVVEDLPDRPGVWTCITVSDAGPGVPKEVRDTLFDAFVTYPVADIKQLGVGLGLALAREVAAGHGGALELDETIEVGARFVLWLPIDKVKESAHPAAAPQEALALADEIPLKAQPSEVRQQATHS